MKKEDNAVLPKNLVEKWILEVMEYQYDITIYAGERTFPEKFMRSLASEGWEIQVLNDNKIIVTSNDPVKLAELCLKVRRQGYLVID